MKVKFDKYQNEFPTTTHQSIWHAAVFMAPFCEMIPPQLTGREAEDLRKGEKSLYQLVKRNLCKGGNSKFALTNFLRCDFRGLLNSHQPGFDDAVSILPDDSKKMAVEMDKFMRNMKCKISVQPLKNTTLHSQWKLFYAMEGKSVYSFHSDTNNLEAFAYFNHYGNVSRMGYLLKEESDRLYTWFYDRIPTRLCLCRNNKLVDIGGHKKRICGLMNRMDVMNPDSYDLKNLKRIIEIYHDKVMK